MRSLSMLLPLLVALSLTLSCRSAKKLPDKQLPEEAIRALDDADFGPTFDQALAVVEAQLTPELDPVRAAPLALARDRALLDLLWAALLSEKETHYRRLAEVLGLQLDGALCEPRNFQLVVQTLMERFRATARRAAEGSPVQARAEALASYAEGLQAQLFRSKHRYFEGRDAVLEFPDLSYLDQLAAVRDLVYETRLRTEDPLANWQPIVLTIFGRICPTEAARYIAMVCMASSPSTAEEYCHSDFNRFPAHRQRQGKGLLQALCRPAGSPQEAPRGLAALKAYYDPAFEALRSSSTLRPTLRTLVERLDAERPAAYEALETFL